MLADWAQPLWDYCVLAKKGIEPLTRLRGKAWLCEPSSEVLRDAIGYLGQLRASCRCRMDSRKLRSRPSTRLAAD